MDVASNRRARPHQILYLQRSLTNQSTILVSSQIEMQDSIPIYIAELHPFAQPSIRLYHGPGRGSVLVGEARSSQTTPNTHLMINGRPYTFDTGSYSLVGSYMGDFKWVKGSNSTRLSMELVDL